MYKSWMFETCRRIYVYIKNMHFVGSYYIGISQCTVEKNVKITLECTMTRFILLCN